MSDCVRVFPKEKTETW